MNQTKLTVEHSRLKFQSSLECKVTSGNFGLGGLHASVCVCVCINYD